MASDIILNDEIVEVLGRIDVKESPDSNVTIRMNPENGNIRLGATDADGDLVLRDAENEERIQLTGGGGPEHGSLRILLDGADGNVILGGGQKDGDLWLKDQNGRFRIELDSGTGSVKFPETTSVYLSGKNGNARLGGGGKDGDLVLLDEQGEETIQLTGGGGPVHSSIRLLLDGKEGHVTVRGPGGAVRVSDDGIRIESGEFSISGGEGGVSTRGFEITIDQGPQRGTVEVARDIRGLQQKVADLEQRVSDLES